MPEDLKELVQLVREGKIFAVQDWVSAGKRTFSTENHHPIPIRIALTSGFHSMVEVLLKALLPQSIKDGLLTDALRYQKYYMIDLLVERGADVRSVNFAEACWTNSPEIMRYFLDRGIDAVTNNPFARALTIPTRPQLRVYFEYRERIPHLTHQLNLALRHHVKEGRIKWVYILLWAGADPRAALPDIDDKPNSYLQSSALEEAIKGGHLEMVAKMRIEPKADNLNTLLTWACTAPNWEMIKMILDMGSDPNPTTSDGAAPMNCLISQLACKLCPIFYSYNDDDVGRMVEVILRFADCGGRWSPQERYEMNNLRRGLYKLMSSTTVHHSRLSARGMKRDFGNRLTANVLSQAGARQNDGHFFSDRADLSWRYRT